MKLSFKTTLHIITGILMIFVARNNAANHSSNVVEMTAHNFDDELNNKSFLVMFYVPNCEKCSGWIQLLRNLSQQLKHTGLDDVGIGTVDCLTDRGLCEEVYLNEKKDLEAPYSMSGRNQLCSSGQHIGEQQECEEAAKYLEKHFVNARSKFMYPEGCYFLHQTTRMYFNTHAWGKASYNAEQICKSEKTQENKRTQLVLTTPKLKFFKSASSDVDYFGLQSLSDLSSFINKQMGRVTPAAKASGIVQLTGQNFDEELSKRALLVMFHTPKCKSCDDWNTLLENLARGVKLSVNNRVLVGKAECSASNTLCKDVDYTMSGTNRLCTDEDRSYVNSVEECEQAAKAMEYEYRRIRERDQYPPGCYFLHDTNFIYYNSHSIGRNNENAEQICRGKGQCNRYFEDRGGSSCQDYRYNKWCTPSGEYGDGWQENYGIFDDFSRNDESAIVCPQCGCKENARYILDLKQPKLTLFASSNSSTNYRGPKTLFGLTSFINEFSDRGAVQTKSESDLMLQAGCKKKKWIYQDDGNAYNYEWVASGKLLEKGVCIDEKYRKEFAPSQERTKIHTTIEYQTVRNVDAKDQTLSFDLILTLKWLDSSIHTYFTKKDKKSKGIVLSKEAYDEIWSPDLFIWNRTSVTSTDRWISLVECKILTSNAINDQEKKSNITSQILKTTVQMKYVIKTTVYCKFHYAKYPMDTQNCSVKIGSSSQSAIFTLFDERHLYHTPKEYDSVGLKMQVNFLGSNNKFGNDTVGFQVQMSRLLQPYLMMYYIPCIAIVLVSELGFLVRLTSDGSVGLLVTQLLTLVNLLIYQMSESPSASDMNILGQYLIVSLGFVVGAVIEFAIIHHLNAARNGELKDENNRVFPEQNIGNNKNKKNRQKKFKKKNKFNFRISFSSLNRFDLGAFLIHFISFSLFNVVYWYQNLN